MKHTEGNWFVSKALSIESKIKDGSVGVIPTIAQVNTVFREEKESLANAKLISAAPDLLEALKEIIAISDRKHDAWNKAKLAIEKAENG